MVCRLPILSAMIPNRELPTISPTYHTKVSCYGQDIIKVFNVLTDHKKLINDDGPVKVLAHQVIVHCQGGTHLKWGVGKLCPMLTAEHLEHTFKVNHLESFRPKKYTSLVN